MIPENKLEAVKKALQSSFGTSKFESIVQLKKGLSSALVFQIIVSGKPYLLRVINRTDAMADPSLYYPAMKAGADAGLAPRIHYMNTEDRVSITDFIIEKPFTIDTARELMPGLIRKLHSLPKFPPRLNYLESVDSFIEKFRAAKIYPDSITNDLFESYARIGKVYPKNDEVNFVSSHNDVKPENIIFDRQRPWLIDWESAFLNDRYVDLSILSNFLITNEKEEVDFLEKYFQEPADDYKLARFFLMRQVLHMFYFTLLNVFALEGRPVDVDGITKHHFRDFHDNMWNGEITLATNETRIQYAWVHMEQLQYNLHSERLGKSLAIVSKHH